MRHRNQINKNIQHKSVVSTATLLCKALCRHLCSEVVASGLGLSMESHTLRVLLHPRCCYCQHSRSPAARLFLYPCDRPLEEGLFPRIPLEVHHDFFYGAGPLHRHKPQTQHGPPKHHNPALLLLFLRCQHNSVVLLEEEFLGSSQEARGISHCACDGWDLQYKHLPGLGFPLSSKHRNDPEIPVEFTYVNYMEITYVNKK